MLGAQSKLNKQSPASVAGKSASSKAKGVLGLVGDGKVCEDDGEDECSELPDNVKDIKEYGWPFVEIDEVCKNPKGVNGKPQIGKKRNYHQMLVS
jgi:hypothetical protein